MSIISGDGTANETPSVFTPDIGPPTGEGSAEESPSGEDVASEERPKEEEEDYNAVDRGYHTGHEDSARGSDRSHEYIRHVVIISVASVLFPVLLLLLVFYFYFGKGTVSKYLKSSNVSGRLKSWFACCKRTSVPSNACLPTPGQPGVKNVEASRLEFAGAPPYISPPIAPPRKYRRHSLSDSSSTTISHNPV